MAPLCLLQIKRAGAAEFADERRITLTISMQGTILAAEPAGSTLYEWCEPTHPHHSHLGCPGPQFATQG